MSAGEVTQLGQRMFWGDLKFYGKGPFRAGHYKDLTETGNHARKVSGGAAVAIFFLHLSKKEALFCGFFDKIRPF